MVLSPQTFPCMPTMKVGWNWETTQKATKVQKRQRQMWLGFTFRPFQPEAGLHGEEGEEGYTKRGQ